MQLQAFKTSFSKHCNASSTVGLNLIKREQNSPYSPSTTGGSGRGKKKDHIGETVWISRLQDNPLNRVTPGHT
ncbi:hypothetical protein PanWU01x14_074670 [Parasponia andersonii]|uniref:Uncharacterized protein n=1 Tax=Parasponia andersonii TaxID=3476 RepID=A0A2P5DDJ3_PARAD|nr:hypothetical protein PanWU01x14_074670 [Parasponia andersonii]